MPAGKSPATWLSADHRLLHPAHPASRGSQPHSWQLLGPVSQAARPQHVVRVPAAASYDQPPWPGTLSAVARLDRLPFLL